MFNILKELTSSIESISISSEGGLNLPFLSLSTGASIQFLLPKTIDNINFDKNGFIIGDLEEELKHIKFSSQKWYKLGNNFYKVLISLQKEQKQTVMELFNTKENNERLIN